MDICGKMGVLVDVKLVDPGREWMRVVVPYCRRQDVIDVGHRCPSWGTFLPQQDGGEYYPRLYLARVEERCEGLLQCMPVMLEGGQAAQTKSSSNGNSRHLCSISTFSM